MYIVKQIDAPADPWICCSRTKGQGREQGRKGRREGRCVAGRQSRLERTFECTLGCLCEHSLGIPTYIRTYVYTCMCYVKIHMYLLPLQLRLRLWLLTIWSCSPWHTTTAHRIAAPIPRSTLPPSLVAPSRVLCKVASTLIYVQVELRLSRLGTPSLVQFSSQLSVRLVSLFSPLSWLSPFLLSLLYRFRLGF